MLPIDNKLAAELKPRIDPHKRFRRMFPLRSGYLICNDCGAIGFEKHWYVDPVEAYRLTYQGKAQMVLCPGCTGAEHGTVQGEVIIESSNLPKDRQALIALIKQTEGECWSANSFAHIASITERDGIMVLRTTTSALATTIGTELHKAFNGNLTISPSAHHKFVRVRWSENPMPT